MIESIIRDAIANKKCLTGLYAGAVRRFAPHALGVTSDGTPGVLAFQYASASSIKRQRGGDWRCFHLDELSLVLENEDRWQTRPNYSLSRQSCLARIDFAVPTSS
ncbi:MAG: hypothetical protein ACREUF_14610 [Solimonas sp.]